MKFFKFAYRHYFNQLNVIDDVMIDCLNPLLRARCEDMSHPTAARAGRGWELGAAC
jgi:hypothetical protein